MPAPLKPLVPFERFRSLDLRLGTITAVDPLPDTDRLVCLTVDFGDELRRVVSGMKQERTDLSELVGMQTLFVVNIEPRRLRGIESTAMVCDVGFEDGLTPALLIPERQLPNGTRAG